MNYVSSKVGLKNGKQQITIKGYIVEAELGILLFVVRNAKYKIFHVIDVLGWLSRLNV